LNLTSPTTTQIDREVLSALEAVARVNAKEFTEKLFASGSVLVSRPAEEAVAADCKEYVEQGERFSVAQIEEIGFTHFWERKNEVVEAVENYCSGKGYYLSALLVTDVVSQTSILVLAAPEAFRKLVSYPEIEPGIYTLEGVVSRKKQLLPFLTHCLAQAK